MRFVEVKALAGPMYVLAADVIAVQIVDQRRCNLLMRGGTLLPCVEPVQEIASRLESFLAGETPAAPKPEGKYDGDAGR